MRDAPPTMVAFDIDSVICNILDSGRQALSRLTSIPPEDIQDTGIYYDPYTHADPQITAEFKRLVIDYEFWHSSEILLNAQPLPGAVEATNLLYQAGKLAAFITRRPPSVINYTNEWLRTHNFPLLAAHHVGSDFKNSRYTKCKSSICNQIGATHLIEDNVEEAQHAHQAGIKIVLVDAPAGRAVRNEFLKLYTDIPLVPTALDAAHMILRS